MTIYTHLDSPLGQLLLASREGKLSGLFFADQRHARIVPGWVRQDGADIFAQTAQQLEEYAAGERQKFDLPHGVVGTAFQASVWSAIADIPFGQTITYSELARRVGLPRAIRAASTATGANPLSWIVPCHRVVGKNGAVTGYAGGLARKSALLQFEAEKSAGREAILAFGREKPALALV